MRILVVDDEPVGRRVLIEELALLRGVDIAGEAANGAEALAQIAALTPDLVLMDLEMPVMTGLEVLQRLGNTGRPIVIVLTAYDQYVRESLDCGAAGYLMKPVDGTRLQRVVEDARSRLPPDGSLSTDMASIYAAAPSFASFGSPSPSGGVGREN